MIARDPKLVEHLRKTHSKMGVSKAERTSFQLAFAVSLSEDHTLSQAEKTTA